MEESMQPDEPGLQPHPERKDRGVIGNNWKKRKNGRGKDPCIFLPRIGCGGTDSWFTAYQNHKKMNEMENTLAQMNQVHIVTEMPETEKRQILGSWWKILQGI